MKNTIKTTAIALLGLTTIQASQMQKYEVKSGKIEYELKASGDIMGMVTVKSIGKKRVIFDDYGVKNLEEKSEVKKETARGNTNVHKTHTLDYMNGNIIYNVNFEHKRIMRMKNHAMDIMALMSGNNVKETGEAMMIKMGGKKLGTGKVLGYTCTVWNLMGVKQCMYKGIPLKIESDIMGMKSIEVAIKAEFDISLGNDDFGLPAYPIYAMDAINSQKQPKELDKSKLAQMDMKDNAQAKVDASEGAEAIKAMGAGLAALAATGIDMSSSKDLTPDQEQVMQKAMIKAMAKSMGGEGKMLAKMKKEMLENEKELEFAKSCFGGADTLKEANACVDKGNKMFDDNEEHLDSWTKADKNEMLQEMAQYEKMIPCIKAAQTMETIQKCIPRDMR